MRVETRFWHGGTSKEIKTLGNPTLHPTHQDIPLFFLIGFIWYPTLGCCKLFRQLPAFLSFCESKIPVIPWKQLENIITLI